MTIKYLGTAGPASYGVLADALAVAGGGNGVNLYAAGDTVSLTIAGASITTNPVAVVTDVVAGVITGIHLREPGVITAAPGRLITLTQSSTSGSGLGATFTAGLGPIAAKVAAPALGTGGGTGNGNLFLGAETPHNALYGFENTFIGDRAGSMSVGAATANTAVGHNAMGNGNGATWTGSFNTFVGNDAGRNITGAVSNNTGIGQSALRVCAGGGNTAVGQNALAAATGSNNTVVGAFAGALIANSGGNVIVGEGAGNKLTNGANANTIIGLSVASTTLVTGSHNILIGCGSTIDAAAAGTNDTIVIGTSSTAIISASGCATPGTALTKISGPLGALSTTVASLPAAAAGNAGYVAFVTDATAVTFQSIVAGGGANKVPVFSDGTNWRIG